MSYLLSTKHVFALLDVKDEAYGNTPLHIACSMYSDTVVTLILGTSRTQLESFNLAANTPLGILDEEIRYVEGELNPELKAVKLGRLCAIRQILTN